MALFRRQKFTIITLLFYWMAIFILTHIPVPRMVLRSIRTSDKIMHFLAYFVLVFLLWFAINPNKKVNWRKAAVWWILLLVVWYGVVDEWLQAYVGRCPDINDFYADFSGAMSGLILLSFCPFWPAALAVVGVFIFILTNFAHVNIAGSLPIVREAFFLFGYAFFTVLWIRYMRGLVSTRMASLRWLIVALSLPTGFLVVVEGFYLVARGGFNFWRVVVSTAAIATVAMAYFAVALLLRFFERRCRSCDIEGGV